MVINLFHFTNSSFCNSCLTNPGQSSLSHEDAIPSEDAGYVGEGDEKDREKINSAFHLSILIFFQIHLYFKIY